MAPTRSERKTRYSIYLSRVRFEDGVLQIEGRTGITLTFVTAFAVALCGILWQGLPTILMLGAVMGLLILGWAIIDLWRAVARLRFDTRNGALFIERRSGSKHFQYEGYGSSNLRLEIRSEPSDTDVKKYSVRLVFENTEAQVPFPLHNSTVSIERAETLAGEWADNLGLAPLRRSLAA